MFENCFDACHTSHGGWEADVRIAIICNDTRGGVQPYVALALGLSASGHEVRAIAPATFAAMFADAGISFAPLSTPPDVDLQAATAIAEKGTFASMRYMAQQLPLQLQVQTRETLQACEDCDLLTGGVGGMIIGLAVAEKLGKPFIESHLQPIGVATDRYPGVMLSEIPPWLGKTAIRLSHHVSEMAIWMPFRSAMAKARDVLGLSGPRPANVSPVIYAFSPRVVPFPPDETRARHVVGYWTLQTPDTYTSPPGLEEFLRAAGPVVSVGFGSMASSDPEGLTSLVIDAVRRAGVRAVLLSGWGGLASRPAGDVFFSEAVPHDLLFPRVAATVHHGGAGTTGATFMAGVPGVIVPFGVDQPFWGSRVVALGTGPEPIPRKKLTSQMLAAALRQAISDEVMQGRAAVLGTAMRAERGVANAVAIFERLG